MNSPDYLVVTAVRDGKVETWFIPKPDKVEITTEEVDRFGTPTSESTIIETDPTAITLKGIPAALRLRLKADVALEEPSMWTAVRDAKGKELGSVELADRIADRLGRDREKTRSKLCLLIASHLNEVWSHAFWTGRETQIADTKAWKARHESLNEDHAALLDELHTLEAFLQDEMGAHEKDHPGTTTIERAIITLRKTKAYGEEMAGRVQSLATQFDKERIKLIGRNHALEGRITGLADYLERAHDVSPEEINTARNGAIGVAAKLLSDLAANHRRDRVGELTEQPRPGPERRFNILLQEAFQAASAQLAIEFQRAIDHGIRQAQERQQ